MNRRDEALEYLAQRTGRLEYRFLRYSAVTDELERLGLDDQSLIMDVGAGMCDFDFYLRTVRGWKGRYLPVDASIDGTNFDDGLPLYWRQVYPDFVTAIEVLEHVNWPMNLLSHLMLVAGRGGVVTTPNTDEYGQQWVRDMDPTHVSPLSARKLEDWGLEVRIESFFGRPRDSILGWWSRENQ